MPNLNRVILAGHLTRDIEIKYLGSGVPVVNVGIGVNNRKKEGNEWVDEPCFIELTIWGKSAEYAAKACGKGSPVLVEGRLKLDTWETDGQKRSKLSVVAERFQALSKEPARQSSSPSSELNEEELPF